MPLPTLDHLLEVPRVAHLLSVSEEYVRRLIRAKKIPVVRLGKRYRIKPTDLEAFIEAQRVASEQDT
jgi:excisionase family DNA binding protein